MSERLVDHCQLVDTQLMVGAVQLIAFGEVKGVIKRFAQTGSVKVSRQGIEICQMFPAPGAGQVRIHKSQNAYQTDGATSLIELSACPVVYPGFALARQIQPVFAFELRFAPPVAAAPVQLVRAPDSAENRLQRVRRTARRQTPVRFLRQPGSARCCGAIRA